MRPSEILASALLFSSAVSAWPSGWDAVEAIKQGDIAHLVRRQDSSSFDLSYTGKQGNTATTESTTSETSTQDSTQTTGSSDSTATNTDDATGSERTTGTAKQTGSSGTKKSGTATTSMKTYDARLPAGGVSMITPNALTTKYYKIKDHITFAWNYTSVSSNPAYIDVLASCSLNDATYTIATNLTFAPTQHLTWDTGKYQSSATVPLLTETYTLIIHDAAKDVSATAMAGYLGTYDQFTFGMYEPQEYTPMAEWQCATCNSAMTQAERQTMWAIFGMVGVTVLSFGWFTGVAGLW